MARPNMDLVRDPQETDLAALTRIYNHYVAHTAVTFELEPLSIEQRRAWFEHVCSGGRYQLVVAEREGEVVGWACSQRFRVKGAYDASVESSVYLAPEAVGVGLGDRLYRTLFERLDRQDVTSIVAAITVPNEASLRLHARHDFTQVGVMRRIGKKLGRDWDVAWWQRVRG